MVLTKRFRRGAVRCVAWTVLQSFLMFSPAVLAADGKTGAVALEVGAETISMNFDGALLKDVLFLFSQQSSFNFVASQEVESHKVTVSLEDVSPKDAINAILSANGLVASKKPGSNIYVVYAATGERAELQTKVFHLKYARLSASPLGIGGQATASDLATSAGTSSSSSSSSSSSATDASSSSTSTNAGMDGLISQFLSPQGKLAADIPTNSLVVTDIPEKIEQIDRIIQEIDVAPPQVILEVHVLEVKKNLASDQGIEWGGTDGALGQFTAGSRTTPFPFEEHIFTNRNNLAATTVGTSTLTLGSVNAGNFKAILHFILSDSDTKILARPRILTQNNEAASIKVSTNQTVSVTTTTDVDTNIQSEEPIRMEVGVQLKMTPQINADNSVVLFLEPSVTTVAASTLFPTTVLDPTTRLVRTMARVKDNQTLVIGGLIDSNNAKTKRKLPFLGDLPMFGKLFAYDHDANTERELLIFITPHIVRGFNSFAEDSATANGRDIAAKKMLDAFSAERFRYNADALDNVSRVRDTIYSKEKAGIAAGQKKADPLLDQQMTKTLDSFRSGKAASSKTVKEEKMTKVMDTLGTKQGTNH